MTDRVFATAFALSLFLHLTMVTLFSIELRYEPKPIRYFPFEVADVRRVEAAPRPVGADASPPLLTMPTGALALPDDDEVASKVWERLAALPKISLPTLRFDEIEAAGAQRPELSLPDPAEFLERQRPSDAWARFGEEIEGLREALWRLPLIESLQPEAERSRLTVRPVPGAVGRISWVGDPQAREILFAPPLDAPWRVDLSALARPITLVFRVDARGRVTQVLAPPAGDEAAASLAEGLRAYRFEPLAGGDTREQAGTFVVEREDGS